MHCVRILSVRVYIVYIERKGHYSRDFFSSCWLLSSSCALCTAIGVLHRIQSVWPGLEEHIMDEISSDFFYPDIIHMYIYIVCASGIDQHT